MFIRRGALFILATLILSSCSHIKDAIGTPSAEEFTDWFKWFVDFFRPNDLSSNQEVFVFTLLIIVIAGVFPAFINSTRVLSFFKKPPFQNRLLSVLLLSPAFLLFPFRIIKHPGWAMGVWVFLRCLFICILLLLTFVILFYLLVILPYIIVIVIIIVIILIFSASN
jgi:hypothetical protein